MEKKEGGSPFSLWHQGIIFLNNFLDLYLSLQTAWLMEVPLTIENGLGFVYKALLWYLPDFYKMKFGPESTHDLTAQKK